MVVENKTTWISLLNISTRLLLRLTNAVHNFFYVQDASLVTSWSSPPGGGGGVVVVVVVYFSIVVYFLYIIGGALPMVSSTGMCRGNAPVLSHFTLNLPIQKASFTFIMPRKFIPCVMAMTFHDKSSKTFCK